MSVSISIRRRQWSRGLIRECLSRLKY